MFVVVPAKFEIPCGAVAPARDDQPTKSNEPEPVVGEYAVWFALEGILLVVESPLKFQYAIRAALA